MPTRGTRRSSANPDSSQAAAALGDRHMFKQRDLGGSAATRASCTGRWRLSTRPYVLTMDDDIAIEPDSILRALAMSRFAKTPMLVGGQMLSPGTRGHLHGRGDHRHLHVCGLRHRSSKCAHDFQSTRMSDRDGFESSTATHRRRGRQLVDDVRSPGMCGDHRSAATHQSGTTGSSAPRPRPDIRRRRSRASRSGTWRVTTGTAATDWRAYFHSRQPTGSSASIHHDGPDERYPPYVDGQRPPPSISCA